MYLLLKEKGNNANVTLMNNDTKASVLLGKLTLDILELLEEKESIKFGDREDEHKLLDAWSFEISDETGKTLSRKAFTMHRPVKPQTKEKKDNKCIDAMDVILGRASYN